MHHQIIGLHVNKGREGETPLTTINAAISGTARYETYEGRKHLVVPVVALREGVVNGYYVPDEELKNFAASWNGVPIPVNHPEANGTNVSANSPEVLERYNVGRFFNVYYEDRALKGEIWVDVEKARALGQMKLLQRLENGDPVEVSTAYFSQDDQTAGKFNGNDYGAVSRNLRPDHLALLPDSIGACSWLDGCGTPRTHQDKNIIAKALGMIANALGVSSPQTKEAEGMTKEEKIKALIANKRTKWTEGDYKILDAMDESILARLELELEDEGNGKGSAEGHHNEGGEGEGRRKGNGKGNGKGSAEGHHNEGEQMTEEQYLASLPPSVRAAVETTMKTQASKKAKIVESLHQNAACKLSKESLEGMGLSTLEELAESFTTDEGADYSGRGVHGNAGEEPEEPEAVLLAEPTKD